LSDNFSWPPAADLAALNVITATQGFSVAASGAFVAGSTYLIEPTRDAAKNISVNATIAANVGQIAVAAPIRTQTGTAATGLTPALKNSGNATITAGSVAAGYTAPASGSPITLTYNSATNGLSGFPASAAFPVTVTDSQGNALAGSPFTADPVTYTSGSTITFQGISFTISGTPSNNDTFQIVKNTAGVSDGRNAALLGQLQTQNTMSGKTATYQAAYAQLVSDNGNKTRQISVSGDAQTALLEQSQSARESLSGVNLDEEAANLIMYQQAYQAAAKSLQIGTGLFDTLLGIMK
jgi:flagellar hook-associated protein 1 FlgK